MSLDEVNRHPRIRVGPAVGLEIIAWTAVAFARLGRTFDEVPEPDELDTPGWYVEPVFGEGERFWDGEDWTSECRLREGGERVIHLDLI